MTQLTRLDAMRQLLGLTSTIGEIKSPRQMFGRDAAKLALPPKKKTKTKKRDQSRVVSVPEGAHGDLPRLATR